MAEQNLDDGTLVKRVGNLSPEEMEARKRIDKLVKDCRRDLNLSRLLEDAAVSRSMKDEPLLRKYGKDVLDLGQEGVNTMVLCSEPFKNLDFAPAMQEDVMEARIAGYARSAFQGIADDLGKVAWGCSVRTARRVNIVVRVVEMVLGNPGTDEDLRKRMEGASGVRWTPFVRPKRTSAKV